MSGLGRFEETVSSLVYRFPPAGDARPAKRRRVEVPAIRSGTGDSAEVAGEAAGGDDASGPDVEAQPAPIETQASAALALAYDSPFAAVLSPDALVPTQGTSLRRPSATAIKSAVEIKSSGHPVLEWVGIYEPQGAAEGHVLGSPNDAAPEVILPELASVEDGQQIGCIDVTVKWAMEDADLLLIDEDGGDMEQAAAEAETRDLFNQIRQIVGNGTGTRFAPLISFRSEVFRRQDSEALTELPILLCRLAADRGDAPTLFGKPLVHPDVRLSTTGRYDRGLPMSVVAGNVSIPTGHGKRHRPSSTLLDAVYSLAKQRDPILFTHNAIVTAKYSSSDDCVSFHLKLPLYLHKDVLASIVEDRGSGRGTFWPLVHDLLNHLHPATSVLTKDGKLLAREPRLEDLGGEIRDLYSALLPDKDREDKLAAKFCQPAKLDCTLLPFQRRTVQWMLGREGVISTEHDLEPWKPDDQDVVRISSGGFWEKMQVSEGKDGVLWIERMTGAIRRDSDMEVEDRSNGGYGILAEEMGLGKTVEVLSLVLSHKPGLHSRPAVPHPPCICGTNVDGYSQDSLIRCSKCSRAYHVDCVARGRQSERDAFVCTDCKGKGKKRVPPVGSMDSLGRGLPFVPATLIVTPQAILSQWIEEINQHAPTTNVVVYSGVKTGVEAASNVANGIKSTKRGETDMPDFMHADIVLTTYEVLQKEVWHAKDDSVRERRFERRYERKSSPLVGITWWRVCLDEAQRVESGVSAAAEMVGLIPRIHAWVVTGTPIGKAGIQDLHGLFLFLKQPRMLMDSILFRRACLPIPSYRNNLLAILSSIMHRNSKEHVKEDLVIPPQEEHIFPISLKEVEREYYFQRWESCQEELKAILCDGSSDEDIPEIDVKKLRKWLLTLRQTCVHPQIGQENKRALGTQLIKSINDVLQWMVRQSATDLTTSERQLVSVRIRRGQALEQRKAFENALRLYHDLLVGVEKAVADARKDVASDRALEAGDARTEGSESSDNGGADQEGEDRAAGATARLNSWLEVEHRLVYFIASIYHSLKNQPLEDRFYERAEAIRQEILGPRIQDVDRAKARVKELVGTDKLDLQIPASTFKGGLTAQELCSQSQATLAALNKQGANMLAWRKKVMDVLMTDLDYAEPEGNESGHADKVAEGEGEIAVDGSNPAGTSSGFARDLRKQKDKVDEAPEGQKKPQGNEYQTSLKLQEDANVYHDAYAESLLDRITLLNGAPRPVESKLHLETSDLLKQLTKERTVPKNLKDLKSLASAFRSHGQGRMGVPDVELQLCQNESRRLTKELERAMKAVETLQKENRLISRLQNARIEYYRALQELSDSVEAAKFTEGEQADNYSSVIRSCLEDERRLQSKIVQLDGRKKYLKHLSEETPEGESRICVICREDYDNAAITACGHFFCLPCLTQWVNHHRKCPTCNASLLATDITRVSFNNTKRKEGESSLASALKRASSFCSVVERSLISKVAKVHLSGSFGSKLDTIIRHILSLDPTDKVVLFSQWDQVLDMLATGLARNGIQYVRFQGAQRNSAAVRFRREPEIRVFILDAKSQSSGLTLVNATHVMLVEPILHPGIELQAINRVHRIGQTKTTHVWRYIVSNTIEEGLFELYETRRMAVSGRAKDLDAEDEEMGPDVENARMLPFTNRGGSAAGGGGELVRSTDIVSLLKGAFGPPPEDMAEAEDVNMGASSSGVDKDGEVMLAGAGPSS